MAQEYIVSSPSVFMYPDADEKSEATDELLFGTALIKLDDGKNDRILCKTDYGYSGYVAYSALAKKQEAFFDTYTVISRYAFLYGCPDYRHQPCVMLPKGSRVFGVKDNSINGFFEVSMWRKRYFIPKKQLVPTVLINSFVSEEYKRACIVKMALSYLGTPYMWAGKTPMGIDCSGLCFMAYSTCGLGVFRDAEFDGRYLRKIPFEALKKADLVYYNGHVVMYLGNSLYIHSSATAGKVTINSFDKKSPLYFEKLDGRYVCCASSLAFEG